MTEKEEKIKNEIKIEVVKKINEFCKTAFEDIEMNTEGSLTDTYKYMSLKNVNTALELCFEETYNKIISLM